MKTFIASMFLVALAYGELPSNSYLPPPPNSRPGGYPQATTPQSQNFAPQIIAARSLEGPQGPSGHPGSHGAHGAHSPQVNAFGRSSHALPQDHATGRFSSEEPAGYDTNAANFAARNALEEINAEPANYNFGYMVNDYQEGTDFGHREERQEERAQGEYHVVLPDGRKQTVSYEADERGFKPQISYEETENFGRSGYDSNASNLARSGYDSNANLARSGYDNNAGNLARSGYDSNANHAASGHDNSVGSTFRSGNHGHGSHDSFGARSNGY